MRILTLLLLSVAAQAQGLFFGLVGTQGGASSCGNGFSSCRTITIPTAKVPADQTGFTFYIVAGDATMKTTGNSGHITNTITQPSNPDITVPTDFIVAVGTCSGTAITAWRFERYTSGTGTDTVLLARTDVSSSSDTVLRMCWGKSGLTTWQGGTALFDSNTIRFYGLGDGSTLNMKDYTGTANGSGVNTPTVTTGQVDGGINFVAASSQAMSISDITGLSNFTISAWFNLNNTSGLYPIFSADNYPTSPRSAATILVDNTLPNGVCEGYDTSGSGSAQTFTYPTASAWHQAVMVRNGTSLNCYQDNSAAGGTVTMTGAGYDLLNIRLGAHYYSGANQEFMDGKEDMFRIDNTARDSNWRTTWYNATSDPATFAVAGSVEH